MLIYSKPCWSRTVDHEPWTRCRRIILGVYYIWCKIFNRLAWIWLSEFLKVPIYQYICLTFCNGLDLVKATFRQDTQSNVIRLQHRLLKIKICNENGAKTKPIAVVYLRCLLCVKGQQNICTYHLVT